MTMTELFLGELERESDASRRVLARVPEGRPEWRPHPKSMKLGYLSALVATMPGWVDLMINRDELDLRPPGGPEYKQEEFHTCQELLEGLDRAVAKGRAALEKTTDEHLLTSWRFLMAGHTISERPRHIMLRDAVFNHMAHHRGQLTVYLRLLNVPLPVTYGRSADTNPFA